MGGIAEVLGAHPNLRTRPKAFICCETSVQCNIGSAARPLSDRDLPAYFNDRIAREHEGALQELNSTDIGSETLSTVGNIATMV